MEKPVKVSAALHTGHWAAIHELEEGWGVPAGLGMVISLQHHNVVL